MKEVFLFIIFFFAFKAESQVPERSKCSYVGDAPLYIKTKTCGGFCSGYVNCFILKGLESQFYAICQSVGDDCPEPKKCLSMKKSLNSIFMGTLSKYKEKFKEAKTSSKKQSGSGSAR